MNGLQHTVYCIKYTEYRSSGVYGPLITYQTSNLRTKMDRIEIGPEMFEKSRISSDHDRENLSNQGSEGLKKSNESRTDCK